LGDTITEAYGRERFSEQKKAEKLPTEIKTGKKQKKGKKVPLSSNFKKGHHE